MAGNDSPSIYGKSSGTVQGAVVQRTKAGDKPCGGTAQRATVQRAIAEDETPGLYG